MSQKYIIQVWNKKKKHWFDYITFYNKVNASRMYDRLKKCCDISVSIRLIEVTRIDYA